MKLCYTGNIVLLIEHPNVNKCTNEFMCGARTERCSLTALQRSPINICIICDLCLSLSTVDAPTLDCKDRHELVFLHMKTHVAHCVFCFFCFFLSWYSVAPSGICVAHWRYHHVSNCFIEIEELLTKRSSYLSSIIYCLSLLWVLKKKKKIWMSTLGTILILAWTTQIDVIFICSPLPRFREVKVFM